MQVLSHSVAAGMSVMTQWKSIIEASHTSEFVEDMDKLFNVFNSGVFSSSATMHHAMMEVSGHKEFLLPKLEWIKKVNWNDKRHPYWIRGWQISIQALLIIWEVLHNDYSLAYLLTTWHNQDPVETFFSFIHHKGVQHDNPDAGQFRAAFRQCMVDSVMIPGKNANCVEDVDNFYWHWQNVKMTAPTPPTRIHHSAVTDNIPEKVKSILAACTLPQTHDGLSE